MNFFRRKIGFLNITILIFLVSLWMSVYIIKGMIGVYSWLFIRFPLPIIGLVLLIAEVILCIFLILRKKEKVFKHLITFLLSIVMFLPLLSTVLVLPMAYPSKIDKTTPSLIIESPFKEDVMIGWGGDRIKDNLYHSGIPSIRWAYDIVVTPYDISSDQNDAYGIWNMDIFSPIKGIVVGVRNNELDIIPHTDEGKTVEGNYIYIFIEETKTYLILLHLKQHSIVVSVGDSVEVGQFLGKVGNSGSTSEPHLHIHHQRQNPVKQKSLFFAEGLPLFFKGGNGSFMPSKGDILHPTLI